MKDNVLSRAFRIADARAAAAFSDPLRRRLVLLLAGQDRSVAEIARVTRLDLKRLHYHVTALRKLGLLVVTREGPRAGRPVKFYRAIADAFFVPAALMAADPASALAVELRDSLARQRDQSREGVLYHLGEDGEPRMRAVRNPAPRNAPAAEYWRVVQLSRPEALRLATDIDDCLKACAHRHRGAGQAYLVHFAFAPSLLPTMRGSAPANRLERVKQK